MQRIPGALVGFALAACVAPAWGLRLGHIPSQVCRQQREHDAAVIFLVPGKRDDGRLNMEKAAKDWDKALMSLQSLHLLNDGGRAEVRIFLDEQDDIPPEDVQELLDAVPASRDVCAVKIDFRRFPPGFSSNSTSPQVRRTKWGYEHMIRFFFVDIFTTDALRGLRYWMRMDADSVLQGPVDMDVFARLDDRPEVAYLHNSENRDKGDIIDGLCDFVRGYAQGHRDQVATGGGTNGTVPACRNSDVFVEGYFNNLEIGRVSAFQAPGVREFLDAVEASHGIYNHRWGDALLRRITVEMFGLGTEPVAEPLMESYKHSWD